jgi:hypothetical protein
MTSYRLFVVDRSAMLMSWKEKSGEEAKKK